MAAVATAVVTALDTALAMAAVDTGHFSIEDVTLLAARL